MTARSIVIRFAEVAILLAFMLFTSGCYGSKETDDVAYVLVVGVDKAEGGKEKFTYQIAVHRAAGSNSQGDKANTPWIVSSIVAPTSAKARMLLNASMSRHPNLSHITAYIISEERAREGLGPRFSYLARNRDFRGSMFLIVVNGSAEEYIRLNKPTLETHIFKFYETSLASASESSYFIQVHLHDFYTRIKNPGGSAYATYSGLNPKTGQDNPAGAKMPEQKGNPYLPGSIPRAGTENPVDWAGLAVFRGDKMVGVLNSDETRAVAILQGKFSKSYVSVVDPFESKKNIITLSVRTAHKPRITVELGGKAPIFNIEVNLECEIMGITSGISYETPDYRAPLENQIANLFKGQIITMIRHTQQLGTDPAGFGLFLRPHFKNTAELDEADLTALYQAADIRVNVTAKLRRTGLTWRTSPLKIE